MFHLGGDSNIIIMNNKFEKIFEELFQAAKSKDEFAYIFALLGINSGIEDNGWQPIGETLELAHDLTSIANTPLNSYTKIRILLLLYCQITEASYLYHILYNMLLCIEGKTPPKVFNFLDQVNKGNPPSVKSKVSQITKKATQNGQTKLVEALTFIFDSSVRNAISHADYILFNDELRLKHKGNEIRKIKLAEVAQLISSALEFFEVFFQVVQKHKTSYKDGHLITGRKNNQGHSLMSIKLKVDEKHGLYGFSGSDPVPLW